MSRNNGLSLIRRDDQGNAVSEILGDLDGHLDRSWIVSMGGTDHDDDDVVLSGRTAELQL